MLEKFRIFGKPPNFGEYYLSSVNDFFVLLMVPIALLQTFNIWWWGLCSLRWCGVSVGDEVDGLRFPKSFEKEWSILVKLKDFTHLFPNRMMMASLICLVSSEMEAIESITGLLRYAYFDLSYFGPRKS